LKMQAVTFTIEEKPDPNIDDIRWDTNIYTLVIEVTDNMNGQLEIENVSVTSENGRNDLVFRNVHEDLITKKEVFLDNDFSINIDNKSVEKGDILTYTISYTNYTGKKGDVTITDTIPEYTTYVDGSADNGGVYTNGVLTWNLTDIAPDTTVTVTFDVKVTDTGVTAENKATVLEGTNSYETNIVSNPVKEDTVIKDVFLANEPTVSIDGETVNKDDILLYKITYINSDDFAADVTITDTIPEYTTYVDGSADNGGVYKDGKLIWNINLAAGESKTVTFKVKVVDTNIIVVNQASALEGNSKLDTNIVKNPVESEPKTSSDSDSNPKPTPNPVPVSPQTGDNSNIHLWFVLLFIGGSSIIGVTVYRIRRKE